MSSAEGPQSPTRSRQRSHNACLTCKRKKTRCPGQRPACSSCTRLNQTCIYPSTARRPSWNNQPAQEDRLAQLEEKMELIFNWGLTKSSTDDATKSTDSNNPRATTNLHPHPRSSPNTITIPTNQTSSPSTSSSTLEPPPPPLPSSHTSTNSLSHPLLQPPDQPDIALGIDLYFRYCHRQPIWCFEREDARDPSALPLELAWSVMALAGRFVTMKGRFGHDRERERERDQGEGMRGVTGGIRGGGGERMMPRVEVKDVRGLILMQVANGTVDLPTIESLCLLSYSSFIDGNVDLGQFDLGLALQLCRTAMLDAAHTYTPQDPLNERKKRLFWSLQVLEQSHGRQTGLLSAPTQLWQPSYPLAADSTNSTSSRDNNVRQQTIDANPRGPPPLPRDDLRASPSHTQATTSSSSSRITNSSNTTTAASSSITGNNVTSGGKSSTGVWNTSIDLGWVWSQVRRYVSDYSHNILHNHHLREPWRHDSTYAQVLSDFMEVENRVPICHRYDSVKFYERKSEEVNSGSNGRNKDYWAPWLREQFTYHAIHAVLNHPFLYIVGAQHNGNLAIPNTFWRRSSELALLHSTWIVRMIDMVVDKQMELVDPFLAHVAAIAATVHLYYCCAASKRLRHKSNTDFAKCRRFLKGFTHHSAACGVLDGNLDEMTRIAAGPGSLDVEDWMPSKIYLSVPLMWKILQFDPTPNVPSSLDGRGLPTMSSNTSGREAGSVLDPSLVPANLHVDTNEASLLEIIVATSPEITINTADGGQQAPTLSHKTLASSSNNVSPSSSPSASPRMYTPRSFTPRTPLPTNNNNHLHHSQQQQQQQPFPRNQPSRFLRPGIPSSVNGGVTSGGSGNGGARQSHSLRSSIRNDMYDEISVEQTDDSLTINTTPWLYADSSQFVTLGNMVYQDVGQQQQQQGPMDEEGGTAWWEGENFRNVMFNHF